MSVAYFIVLDNEEVDFDTFVNGKAIAHASDELVEFCEKHKLKTIEDFFSQDASEFKDEFDDVEMPEKEVLWFNAQEGIDWATTFIEKLNSEKPKFSTVAVIEDLQEYLDVFNKTKAIGAKWHLELDF